jgi:hypothetical protein
MTCQGILAGGCLSGPDSPSWSPCRASWSPALRTWHALSSWRCEARRRLYSRSIPRFAALYPAGSAGSCQGGSPSGVEERLGKNAHWHIKSAAAGALTERTRRVLAQAQRRRFPHVHRLAPPAGAHRLRQQVPGRLRPGLCRPGHPAYSYPAPPRLDQRLRRACRAPSPPNCGAWSSAAGSSPRAGPAGRPGPGPGVLQPPPAPRGLPDMGPLACRDVLGNHREERP